MCSEGFWRQQNLKQNWHGGKLTGWMRLKQHLYLQQWCESELHNAMVERAKYQLLHDGALKLRLAKQYTTLS